MLIGELVERTGLTKDTIRFYEKKGLIAVDRRSRQGKQLQRVLGAGNTETLADP